MAGGFANIPPWRRHIWQSDSVAAAAIFADMSVIFRFSATSLAVFF